MPRWMTIGVEGVRCRSLCTLDVRAGRLLVISLYGATWSFRLGG